MSIKNTHILSRPINNRPVKNRNHISRHRGFTLMEALLGFFILSVGMLGVASLQAISLKAGKTSSYGSVAIMKANELFESMRANPGTRNFPNSLASYANAGATHNCIAAACNATQLAEEDKYWWEKNLTAGLPAGATATVLVSPPPASSSFATVTVTINWNERDKNSATSVAKSYTTTAGICTTNPC